MFVNGSHLASTQKAFDVLAVLESGMTANGWLLADTVAGVDSHTYRVWRNPAANNSAAREFFVVISRASDTATDLIFQTGERWDAATKKLFAFTVAPVTSPAKTVAPDGQTVSDAQANPIDVKGTDAAEHRQRTTVSLGTQHLVSTTKDYVMLSTDAPVQTYGASNNAIQMARPGHFVMAGVTYDTLVPPAAGYDPAISQLLYIPYSSNPNCSLSGCTTREFTLTAGQSISTTAESMWRATAAGGTSLASAFTPVHGNEIWTGKPLAGRISLGRTQATSSYQPNLTRGVAKSMLCIPITGVTPLWGDEVEITIDGSVVRWMCVYPLLGHYVDESA